MEHYHRESNLFWSGAPDAVSETPPAGGPSPAGVDDENPPQVHEPGVSPNSMETELSSLNQITGDLAPPGGGWLEEMVDAVEAADVRGLGRDNHDISSLPPGGPLL